MNAKELEIELKPHFSIAKQLTRTQAISNVEEILKNENSETNDYIYRIEKEPHERRNVGFVRYKCASDSENPIFDDELKNFQIYTEVNTVNCQVVMLNADLGTIWESAARIPGRTKFKLYVGFIKSGIQKYK